MKNQKIFAVCFVVLIISAVVNARPQSLDIEERDADPGWVRRQLMRAGEAATRVGSSMGGFAVKLTNAVERICGIIKKIIPIVGAVCTVGQFQFCALDNTTGDFSGPSTGGSSFVAGPGVVDLTVQD